MTVDEKHTSMELCRIADVEGRPCDAYRHFLDASEDGILSDNYCDDGICAGLVQYDDLLDCPVLQGEWNFDIYGKRNYAYPRHVISLYEQEHDLVLMFHGFGIHCHDLSRGIYGDEIDYDEGKNCDMHIDPVHIPTAEAEKKLVLCEDGRYAFFLLTAKGHYRYNCEEHTAGLEMGILLKKDGNGWSIVSDEPQESDLREKVWAKLDGFVRQNYPQYSAGLHWPDFPVDNITMPEAVYIARELQDKIWFAAKEKYHLCSDRWERLLEEHWDEWTEFIRESYDEMLGMFNRKPEKETDYEQNF